MRPLLLAAPLTTLLACTPGPNPSTSTDATSTGAADSATTTSDVTTTSTTEVGGPGTTFDPPGYCPPRLDACAPQPEDSGADNPWQLCEAVHTELEATAAAQCAGAFALEQRYYTLNDCCIQYTCDLMTERPKACIPLESKDDCDPCFDHVFFDSQCGQLGQIGQGFVEGDRWCVHFECFCDPTGG